MHVCFEGRKPRFRSNYRVGAFVPSRIVHFSRHDSEHEDEFKKKNTEQRTCDKLSNWKIGFESQIYYRFLDKSKP